eukprot:8351598-Pyramimonas_sp.AAC.1
MHDGVAEGSLTLLSSSPAAALAKTRGRNQREGSGIGRCGILGTVWCLHARADQVAETRRQQSSRMEKARPTVQIHWRVHVHRKLMYVCESGFSHVQAS